MTRTRIATWPPNAAAAASCCSALKSKKFAVAIVVFLGLVIPGVTRYVLLGGTAVLLAVVVSVLDRFAMPDIATP